MTLPSSHIVSGDLARIGKGPIFGGFADVWQGTHGGREVCIKALRISLNDDESLAKVCIRRLHAISLSTEHRLWVL